MGRPKLPKGETKAEKQDLKHTPLRSGEELSVYASGNGSLSFVWQTKDYASGNRIATGRTVTMDDARKYLGTNPRGVHLIEQGWKLWSGNGSPILVADVERIGPNRLRMGDQEYTYHINQNDPFYRRDGEIRQVALTLSYEGYTEEYAVDSERTVRNVGTLAAVAFFLNHEKGLQENPPESLTYQVV